MSKIFKGIAKVAKKIFKTIKKVFKKVWSSPLGKVLLFAAVVYTGGVIAGSWGGSGPLSFLAPATSQAAAAGTGLVSDLGGGALGVVSEGGVALTEVGAKAGGGILKNIMANMGFGEGGFLGKGGWVQRNKLVSAMGLGGIMNATAPDPYEEADKDRQRRWDGADSLNVDLYSKLRG